MGVEREPRVPKVPGHDARLILLVIVHPEFDRGLGNFHVDHDTAAPQGSGS
jgi:hypothetical protein